ncbi:LPS assembly protein LptD [Thiotrichales bacterium 19S9-12]|nr:LPS assembly protein LptD [Thiotrichales bacterium 19S9-11]MCF6811290.1 LPS assembly protein LptD [Thiotrichales bacterium 19S9-12]
MTPQSALRKKKILSVALFSLLAPSVNQAEISLKNPLQKNWECQIKDGKWLCFELDDDAQALFQKNTNISEKQIILAKALGWVPTNDPKNICGGYYYQPPAYDPSKPLDENTHLRADEANYTVKGSITAQGNVRVKKGTQTLSANKATVSPNQQNQKLSNIEASGNVSLRQPGQLVISDKGKANLNANTATLNDTYYLINVVEDPSEGGSLLSSAPPQTNACQYTHFTGYGRGHADTVYQLSETRYKLKNASYTTAPPTTNTWTLTGTTIDLDKESGRGEIYNSVLWAKDFPVFYSPYFNFPIDSRRQTGFLYPTAGYQNDSGYYLSTPFYVNLAPNYDLLVTPTLYNHRGLMVNNKLRFLTETQDGLINLSYMPNDNIDHRSRSALDVTINGQYNKYLSSYFDYHYVSDDQFIDDFASNDIISANQTLLNREFQLKYADPTWNINGTLLDYNVIDPELTLANRPYATLPQINATMTPESSYDWLKYGFSSQFTYFYKSPYDNQEQVNGQRIYLAPYVETPLKESWGYLTPKLTFTSTEYWLQDRDNSLSNPGFPSQYVSRNLPIFNIDTGVYFDGNFQLESTNYQQTIKPRLFYTYIPYRNQNNIPIFDTSFTNFTYNSLFTSNRFSGYDRINNANQLSYSLETSIQTDTGKPILSGGVGQIAYFTEQKVSVCRTANCIATENPDYDDDFSDIAGFLSYHFLDDWTLTADMTYHVQSSRVDSQNYTLQYKPNPGIILNASYNNTANDYSLLSTEQLLNGTSPPSISSTTLSGLYQLTENWSLIGLWNYSFTYKRSLNMFAGISYDACSWSFRFAYQRYISNDFGSNSNNPSEISGPLDTALIFQVQLKGLGSSSGSQLNGLLDQINGYTPKSPF